LSTESPKIGPGSGKTLSYVWFLAIGLCLLGGLAFISTWRVLGSVMLALGAALIFYCYRIESLVKEATVRTVAAYLSDTNAQENSRGYQIRRQLNLHRYDDKLEKPVGEALDQLTRLEEAFGRFEKVLKQRLNPGELTYQRFHQAADALLQTSFGLLEQKAALVLETGSPPDAIREMSDWVEKAIGRLSELNQALARMQSEELVTKLGSQLTEMETLRAQTSKYFNQGKRHG